MACRFVSSFARLAVVFALAIAMASSGFAHRSASVPIDEGLLIYVEAGGSLTDLCGDLGSDGAAAGQTCDACRLVDAATVYAVIAGCHTILGAQLAVVLTPPPLFVPLKADDPSRPVRAPPVA